MYLLIDATNKLVITNGTGATSNHIRAMYYDYWLEENWLIIGEKARYNFILKRNRGNDQRIIPILNANGFRNVAKIQNRFFIDVSKEEEFIIALAL